MTLVLRKIAKKLSLLETGGSDFHSPDMDKFNKVGDFQIFGGEINFPFNLNLPPEVSRGNK